ncbi:MAG: hypothetical protein EHM72_18610 [Calditrichaeota bacterium]|nr:MAG: hypothetical protein EHM72_18610 [Calditrichota bacterium]
MPMFWPIAASAFFLTWPYTAAVACLAPLVSSLMTGMPPISPPILHVMVIELFVLVTTIRGMRNKNIGGMLVALAAGLLLSRIVLFLIVAVAAPLLGLPGKVFSMAMVIKGVPGIVLMLILLPIVVCRIRHEPFWMTRKENVKATSCLF